MRQLAALALLALLVLGCIDEKALLERFAPKDHDQLARQFLERLRQADYAAAHAMLEPTVAASTATADVERLGGFVNRSEPVAVELIGANVRFFKPLGAEGTHQSNLTYEIQFQQAWLLATFVISSTKEGPRIYSGNLQPLPDSLRVLNRFTLRNKSLIHYLFLTAVAGVLILILVALVLCVRSKVRRRWLWMIFILVGLGKFSLNWSTGQWEVAPVSILLFGAAYMRASSYAPVIVSVGMPVGAIVFLLLRRRLQRRASSELPGDAAAEPPPL